MWGLVGLVGVKEENFEIFARDLLEWEVLVGFRRLLVDLLDFMLYTSWRILRLFLNSWEVFRLRSITWFKMLRDRDLLRFSMWSSSMSLVSWVQLASILTLIGKGFMRLEKLEFLMCRFLVLLDLSEIAWSCGINENFLWCLSKLSWMLKGS